MKPNVRLSIATVLTAALAVPTTVLGAESANASRVENAASSTAASAGAGKLVSHFTGHAANHQTVTGTFTPQQFNVVDGQLMATGVFAGVVHGKGKPRPFSEVHTVPVKAVGGVAATGSAASTSGTASRTSSTAATSAVYTGSAATAPTAATCDILHLTLGPLDLDLLGLQVHLNRIVLDIVAQSGPGNLLGNLLCAVAGLLDDTSGGVIGDLLGQITDLLNQILDALGLATTTV